ncbi:hypothetical protein D3C87_1766120 [compost metagenome]
MSLAHAKRAAAILPWRTPKKAIGPFKQEAGHLAFEFPGTTDMAGEKVTVYSKKDGLYRVEYNSWAP